MPYYREYFANRGLLSSFNGAARPIMTDQLMMTSFRTKPSALASSFQEILDIDADPYAYFLSSVDRKRYYEALRLRNLPEVGKPDHGHPFQSVRHQVIGPHYSFLRSGTWENAIISYAGTGLNSVHNGTISRIPTFPSGEVTAFAQQAYARVAPTSVVFDAANFLGELRERLPHLGLETLKDSSRFFRSLGSDYLNVEFGWKPFIRDLINAAKAIETATRELPQQGQRVHRRYSVPTIETNGSTTSFGQFDVDLRAGQSFPVGLIPTGFPIPSKVMGYQTPFNSSVSNLQYSSDYAAKRVTKDRWFEGEFSSFYPLDFDPSDYFKRLDVLVNTDVTPEVLWNLTPWTWLVDWNLRIGDSISANQLRANDLLVMHYGYAMERSVYTTTTSLYGPTLNVGDTTPLRASSIIRTTRKLRIRANPYGFTVGGTSGLSASQLAILAALGLTKSGN